MNEKDEQAELAALLRRAQDLADRCDRAGVPTSTKMCIRDRNNTAGYRSPGLALPAGSAAR